MTTLNELEETQSKFLSIFNSPALGVIMAAGDKEGIIEWNLGAEKIFGYSEKEALGKSIMLLMPKRYRRAHNEGLLLAIKHNKTLNNETAYELTGLRKNGQEFPLELTFGNWKKEGKFYFSAIAFDATKHRQAEKTLRRSEKMNAVGQLASGIAHDFNNILNIILGNLELLEDDIPDKDKIIKRRDTIRKSTQRASDLTRQLLNFSSNKPVEVVVSDINSIIRKMDNLISHSITPDITVYQQLDEDLWLTEINVGDFQDMLINLVLNARDAMQACGKLSFETSNCILDENFCTQHIGITPGQYIKLSISDNGSGMTENVLTHIFEPFFTTKTENNGTGLGLAMTYGFTKRSAGYVSVDSKVNLGTTFHIYLPRASESKRIFEKKTKFNAPLPGGHETILIVDDEVELIKIAQTSLQAIGYRVLTTTNAKTALTTLAENPDIGLLFSDIVMHDDFNGYQLAKLASANYPKLKILLTSGHPLTAIEKNEKCLSFGFLNKPYNQIELAQQVQIAFSKTKPEKLCYKLNLKPTKNRALPNNIKNSNKIDKKKLLDLLPHSQQLIASNNESHIILKQLRDCIKLHFEHEEELMKRVIYPGLENHQQVHQLLLKQIERIQLKLHQNEQPIGKDLRLFHDIWLTDHAQSMDCAFTNYLESERSPR